MKTLIIIAFMAVSLSAAAEDGTEISAVPRDLQTPSMQEGSPTPGKRVRMVAPGYRGTDVHHSLYLPTDWQKGKKYPLIVEYAGNGPYRNERGDTCSGKSEQ